MTEQKALCKRCGVFVGFGAMGVVKLPEGKDREWLANHCWICERHRIQIVASQHLQGGVKYE